jgi:Asp-tRNA(Asn)/Glu-tRNA(Gln) amidotransferase A subunit family amidase
VGVIIPTQACAALLKNKTELLEKAKQRPLSEEEQAALLAQEVLPELGGDPNVALAALRALDITVVEIDDATLPPGPDTAGPLLFCNFRQGAADFFGALPQPFPVRSLADVVAINDQDPANRAPYGQGLLARAAQEPMTAEEYARIHAVAAALAHQWMDTVLETNGVDVLVSGMAYTGSAGAAGVPALTVPAGLDPSGRPQGIILTGDYLSDPQLLSLGFALEQQIGGRVEPDLPAVIDQIDAVRIR